MVNGAVTQLTDGEAAKWDGFVRGNERATPFHTHAWKQVVESTYGHKGHYLICSDDGEISGALPLFHVRSPLGSALVALPYAGTQPSLLTRNSGAQRQLCQAALQLARELKVGHLELRELEPLPLDWDMGQSYVNVELPLGGGLDQVWKRVESRVRTKVRAAERRGLAVEWAGAERLDEFFDVYGDTMHRLGSPPHNKALFRNIFEAYSEGVELALVTDGAQTVAGALVMHDGRWFGFPWAGSSTAAMKNHPNNLLYWALIERACKGGYRSFDLGRSPKASGTAHFKVQWGGTARPLHYYYALVTASKLPQREASDPLMLTASRIWRHLPIGLANRLGPSLARLIP
jgi:FemAB-related protein (PEP-CTERM system-associated)